jgi:hypothetical protein
MRKLATVLVLLSAVSLVMAAIGCGQEGAPKVTSTSTPEPTLAPEPTGLPSPTVSPLKQTKHYSDSGYGFSFDYPASWELVSEQEAVEGGGLTGENFAVAIQRSGSHVRTRVAISVEEGGPASYTEAEYQDYAKRMDQAGPSLMSDFRKVSDRIVTVDGMKALEYIWVYDPKIGSGLDEIKQVTIVKNGKAYQLSCGAPPVEFDKSNEEAFEPLIQSFHMQ